MEVKFTADAFGFKKDKTQKLDPSVAWGLVCVEKVAVYTNKKAQEAAEEHIKKAEKAEKKRKAHEKKVKDEANKRFDKLKKEKNKRFAQQKAANSKRFIQNAKDKKDVITLAEAEKLRKSSEENY